MGIPIKKNNVELANMASVSLNVKMVLFDSGETINKGKSLEINR